MAHANIELIAQIKESDIDPKTKDRICQILLTDIERARKDAEREKAKTAVSDTAPQVSEALTLMVNALNTPIRLADVGNRIGLSNRVPAQRSLLMKAFKLLEKQGQIQQVGWKNGQIKETSEVNNFQRRWIPAGWEPTKAQ